MKLTDVIRRPLITEKTTMARENSRTVVFEVAAGATKVDIKRAVEKLLGSDHGTDPAEQAVSRERMEDMRRSMAEMLSVLEVDVLRLYVEGKSYQEISERLGRHVKSIDNALQRIKRKVDMHLQERAAEDSLVDA